MIRAAAPRILLLLAATVCAWSAEPVVVDFEKTVPLLADGNANRVPQWEEKGVVFTLARQPQQTKGKGLLMFFTHLATGHKGIACAMATESIPVRATFRSRSLRLRSPFGDLPGRWLCSKLSMPMGRWSTAPVSNLFRAARRQAIRSRCSR
jgi:hypothetical protein